MNAKERVKRAIHFGTPDRVPNHLPEPWPSDIVWIFPKGKDISTEIRDGKTYRLSEWSSWWHVVSEQNMGEVVKPAVEEWSQYEHYVFPSVNDPERYDHVAQIVGGNQDKYLMGVLSASLFPHYWEIRGLMNFYGDLIEETEKMEQLLDALVDIQLASLETWTRYPVDGIVVGFDDWGLQDRLMISPELFRKFFLPRYAKVWSRIHAKGLDVILHSCGDITSILPDMMAAGLDVINMDQQENMGLERLGREFGGKICFWNPVDIQTVMLDGTQEEIDLYVEKMIRCLASDKGGFIGKYYTQPEAVHHTPERNKAAFDSFVRHSTMYNDFHTNGAGSLECNTK